MDLRVEQTAVDLMEKYGCEAVAVVADVRDPQACLEAAERAAIAMGGIDVVCAMAGVCRLSDFLATTDGERDFHIDVNIKGVWNTVKAALPHMLKKGKGSVVVMSSVTGDLVADPGETAYALTKAALVGFTKALAVEYAGQGIRCNAIQLGYARTPMAESIARQSNPEDPEAAFSAMAAAIPMGRLARPVEVGELAAFLGCDESSYITGAQMVIDGGSTLPESVMGL